jgi:hypothetical protein
MASRRPPRLNRLPLGRTATIGGALAGFAGGLATLLLLLQRALLHDLAPGAGFAARAALVGSDAAWIGAGLQLLAPAAIGGLFGWRTGVRSGLELALRGLLLAVVLWALGWLVLPWAAPGLWNDPLAPALGEYLLFGALLGLQARLCRRMLKHRIGKAQSRPRATARRPVSA